MYVTERYGKNWFYYHLGNDADYDILDNKGFDEDPKKDPGEEDLFGTAFNEKEGAPISTHDTDRPPAPPQQQPPQQQPGRPTVTTAPPAPPTAQPSGPPTPPPSGPPPTLAPMP
uniref:Uncharacterized protein n=1 Tax=Romanomermis culicivorax TaxID=13658 RepID=A0A915KVV3_ROMCU